MPFPLPVEVLACGTVYIYLILLGWHFSWLLEASPIPFLSCRAKTLPIICSTCLTNTSKGLTFKVSKDFKWEHSQQPLLLSG